MFAILESNMKNEDELKNEVELSLEFYPRKTDSVSVELSVDVVEALEKKANEREIPLGALLNLYIGQGLRQDLSDEEAKELALKRLRSRNGPSQVNI